MQRARYCCLTLRLIVLAVAGQMLAHAQRGDQSPASLSVSEIRDIYRAAFDHPRDPGKVSSLKDILPKINGYYLIEGDLMMTDDELQAYLESKQQVDATDSSAELLVATYNGDLDYYARVADRTLTYSVDRDSFPSLEKYKIVVKSVQAAAHDWEASCPNCKVKFAYIAAYDAKPSVSKTNFVVRSYDLKGAAVAVSFFPHDPAVRRYIYVDPSYFTSSFDKVGVFRHEFGHVLGYRHEHIRGVPGCSADIAVPNQGWKPLTDYDPKSVMHYFCGSRGTLELRLTVVDIDGHRSLYGTSIGARRGTPSQVERPDAIANQEVAAGLSDQSLDATTLVVRIEGGDVTAEAADVLTVLNDYKALRTVPYRVQQGDTISSIYSSVLNIPGANGDMVKLAKLLNRHNDIKHLLVGSTIDVPESAFKKYQFSKIYDMHSKSDVASLNSETVSWRYLKNARPAVDPKNGTVKLDLIGYELRVRVPNSKLHPIVDGLDALQHKNLLASYVDPGEGTSLRFFSEEVEPHLYLKQYRASQKVDLNKQAFIGDLIDWPDPSIGCDPRKKSGGHPYIVLLDRPVFYHRSLDGNVDHMSGPSLADPIDRATSTVRTYPGDYKFPDEHGTHLAGIMVAGDVGYGIVGLDPKGHVDSWNWPQLSVDVTALADDIQSLARKPVFPIYVFASEWKQYQTKTILTRLDNLRPLWIVSAGESQVTAEDDHGEDSHDIDATFPGFPMRYGMKSYIIEVTACQECTTSNARLMNGVNYSTAGFVQVAAAGDNIPSTISTGGFDSASGASQATAMTAGVVSAMRTCWPDSYQKPEDIKFRIQLTSAPRLKGSDLAKIAAGVVDAKAAMLDPSKNWILQRRDTDEQYVPFKPIHWCNESFSLTNDVGQETELVRSKRIRRIVKEGNGWFIFAEAPPDAKGNLHPDRITRIGPGTAHGDGALAAILRTDSGDLLLSQIKDLILADMVPSGACR